MVLFAPYAYYIPKAGLAGILMLSAWRLVDRQQLVYYLRTTRFDAWIVLLTAISAVVVSVEFCVLIGVFLSFVLYVPQAAAGASHRADAHAGARRPRANGRRRAVRSHPHLQPGRRVLLRRGARAGRASRSDRPHRRARRPRRRAADEARSQRRRRLHERARSIHRPYAGGPRDCAACAACGPIS